MTRRFFSFQRKADFDKTHLCGFWCIHWDLNPQTLVSKEDLLLSYTTGSNSLSLLVLNAAYIAYWQVTIPFFVLHGEADTVTDPNVSRALYELASSVDKTIKLYPGMWHGLTAGETDSNIEVVFKDITDWLDKRSGNDCTTYLANNPQDSSSPENGTTAKSPRSIPGQKPQNKCLGGRYLCGWKASQMHHNSPVQT